MPSSDYKCFYEELEVSKSASMHEIKRSYKKLALKYHPDRNPERVVESQERFKKISRAYKVLSDPQQRELYDCNPASFRSGAGSRAQEFPFNFPYSQFQQNSFPFTQFTHNSFPFQTGHAQFFSFGPGGFGGMPHGSPFGGAGINPDLFEMLFSMGSPMRSRRRSSAQEASDSNAEFLQRMLMIASFMLLTSGFGAELFLSIAFPLLILLLIGFFIWKSVRRITIF